MNGGYAVVISPSAWRDLMKLTEQAQSAVFDALEGLEREPRPSGVVKMQGTENLYRVRSGNYRIIYEVQDDVLRVLVVKIGDRRDIYKKR